LRRLVYPDKQGLLQEFKKQNVDSAFFVVIIEHFVKGKPGRSSVYNSLQKVIKMLHDKGENQQNYIPSDPIPEVKELSCRVQSFLKLLIYLSIIVSIEVALHRSVISL
jgi:hypothetical protein